MQRSMIDLISLLYNVRLFNLSLFCFSFNFVSGKSINGDQHAHNWFLRHKMGAIPVPNKLANLRPLLVMKCFGNVPDLSILVPDFRNLAYQHPLGTRYEWFSANWIKMVRSWLPQQPECGGLGGGKWFNDNNDTFGGEFYSHAHFPTILS